MPKTKVAVEIPDSPELAQYKADQSHWLAQNMSEVLLMMLATGAKKIAVEFAGSGDSGQIDCVTYYSSAEASIEMDVKVNPHFIDVEKDPELDAIAKKLEDFYYARLEDLPYDWVNNEGGGGTMIIDVETGECTINGFEYVTETVDHPIVGWGDSMHNNYVKTKR
jgi:hypothetical protein